MENQHHLLDLALAGRVSQADKDGWKTFTQDISKRIQSYVSPPVTDAKQRTQQAAGFFRTLQQANAQKAAQHGGHQR